jgi:threonine synthase
VETQSGYGTFYTLRDSLILYLVFLIADRQRLTFIGATRGDAGSAAIHGLRGKRDISVFVMFPQGQVAPIQEAQISAVPDENFCSLAITGTFDDCQVGCPNYSALNLYVSRITFDLIFFANSFVFRTY